MFATNVLGLLATTDAPSAGMGIIAWIILGLIAGFIASKIVNRRGEGLIRDILLGVVGAVVGGAITHWLGIGPAVTGVNIPSLIVAVIGAVVFLLIWHAIRRVI